MNPRFALGTALGVFALTLTILVVVFLTRRYRRAPSGHGLLDALRLTTAAPAFFVPASMTAVICAIVMFSTGKGGENPWQAHAWPSHAIVQWILLLLISGGVAGQVGLLEARRDGREVGPDAFLDGIRRHTVSVFVAKALLAGAVVLMWNDHWNLRDFRIYLWMAVPSFLLAPVLGTVSHHPGRPIQAVLAAAATAIRHPFAIGRVFVFQFATLAIGTRLIDEFVYSHSGRVLTGAATHANSLSFHLFPFLGYARWSDGLGIATVLILLSPVFVNAYWLATCPVPALSRSTATADATA